MPATCYVPGCKNRGGEFKFYNIPRGSGPFKRNRRRLWLQAIKGVEWTESKLRNARICNAHFISGESSLDYSSPDFVPSVFVCTNLRKRSKRKERGNRSKQRDDICPTPSPLETAYSVNVCPDQPGHKRLKNQPAWEQPLHLDPNEVEVTNSTKRAKGKRKQKKAKAPVSTPTSKTVADPIEPFEGSFGVLDKKGHKVKEEDIVEVVVGEDGVRTCDFSTPPEMFIIEGSCPAISWEQATVNAIKNLRSSDTTVTATQIDQTVIANLKDENDFLRAQNANLLSELKAKQWMHEQELRDLQERLDALKQRCSCGAMSDTTLTASEVSLSSDMVTEIKMEPL